MPRGRAANGLEDPFKGFSRRRGALASGLGPDGTFPAKREAAITLRAGLLKQAQRQPLTAGSAQRRVRAPVQPMSQGAVLLATETAQRRIDETSLEQANLRPLAADEGGQELRLHRKRPGGSGGRQLKKLTNGRNEDASGKASSRELGVDPTALPTADRSMHSLSNGGRRVTGEQPDLANVVAKRVKGRGSPVDTLKSGEHGGGRGVADGIPDTLRAGEATPGARELADKALARHALRPDRSGPVGDGEGVRRKRRVGVILVLGVGDEEGKIDRFTSGGGRAAARHFPPPGQEGGGGHADDVDAPLHSGRQTRAKHSSHADPAGTETRKARTLLSEIRKPLALGARRAAETGGKIDTKALASDGKVNAAIREGVFELRTKRSRGGKAARLEPRHLKAQTLKRASHQPKRHRKVTDDHF